VVLRSAEKEVRKIYDKVPLEALTSAFFRQNELLHSSKFHDILLDFSFLEPRREHLIIFFIYGRLGYFDDFPSTERYS